MEHATRIRLQALLVFAVALALFTLGIWNEQPQGFDDRWALFLQEMFRHGPSLFPTTYGRPYADYPGTATFLSYLCAQLFGAPNHLANVLPTAVASAGVLALLYRLLAPSSRAWAMLAVLLTALTTQWLEKSRSVCLDQMSSLLCLAAFYLLHRSEQLGSRRLRWSVLPLFALGFAIRGPLGLVEVCGVACTYWALGVATTREQSLLRIKRVLGYGVAGLLLLAGGWWLLMRLAHIAGGDSFAQDVRNMQVGGRLDESGKPFFFYFQLSLYRYFPVVPLALATLIALRHRWKVRGQHADVQLTIRLGACGLMILLGLSVPHFKRAYYVLPMVPMFAAVAAYGLLNAQGWLARVAKAYLWLVAVLPALGIVIVFVCHHLWHKHDYWPDASLFLLVGVLVLLQMAALWAWCGSAQRARRLVLLSLTALAAQWWLLVQMVEPEQDRQFDTQAFVSQVEALRADAPGRLVFVNLGRDTWAIRYMMNLSHDEVPEPLFIGQSDLAPLASLPHPAWVIVARSERNLLDGTALQGQEPVYSGHLNGNALLVFKAP
ncbi:ArnT family glycosyltransferase [Pseudomonas sp. TE3610]